MLSFIIFMLSVAKFYYYLCYEFLWPCILGFYGFQCILERKISQMSMKTFFSSLFYSSFGVSQIYWLKLFFGISLVPGIAAHLQDKFHRKFSLFDASAWKNIPHRPYFHFLLIFPLLCFFLSRSDAFCLYLFKRAMACMMEVIIIMNDKNQI